MVAFPIAKLAYLAVRQVSKPIANVIKKRAKTHPFFRTYVCMPPAQIYHWLDVNIRMRILGLGKAEHVEKLKDEIATDLGAEMLGEFVIFSIAAFCLFLEYKRSSAKEEAKENARKQQILTIEQKVETLEQLTEQQEVQLKNLECVVAELTKNRGLTSRLLG